MYGGEKNVNRYRCGEVLIFLEDKGGRARDRECCDTCRMSTCLVHLSCGAEG